MKNRYIFNHDVVSLKPYVITTLQLRLHILCFVVEIMFLDIVVELVWELEELLTLDGIRSIFACLTLLLLQAFLSNGSSDEWGTCRWHSNAQVSGVLYSTVRIL